jgi:hypothetical protein
VTSRPNRPGRFDAEGVQGLGAEIGRAGALQGGPHPLLVRRIHGRPAPPGRSPAATIRTAAPAIEAATCDSTGRAGTTAPARAGRHARRDPGGRARCFLAAGSGRGPRPCGGSRNPRRPSRSWGISRSTALVVTTTRMSDARGPSRRRAAGTLVRGRGVRRRCSASPGGNPGACPVASRTPREADRGGALARRPVAAVLRSDHAASDEAQEPGFRSPRPRWPDLGRAVGPQRDVGIGGGGLGMRRPSR